MSVAFEDIKSAISTLDISVLYKIKGLVEYEILERKGKEQNEALASRRKELRDKLKIGDRVSFRREGTDSKFRGVITGILRDSVLLNVRGGEEELQVSILDIRK